MGADTTFYPIADRQPEADALVWRYMDILKFIDLVQTKCLFFPRITEFNDAFEGYSAKSISPTHVFDMSVVEMLAILVRHHVYVNSWNNQKTESVGL